MRILDYIITALSFLNRKKKRKLIKQAYNLRSKKGIEIGGPSDFFRRKTYFPIYVFANKIDGVNFSDETIWEGKIDEGKTYKYYQEKTGYQFICEATNLRIIADSSYDFLLSCHNLEHIANPIKALIEWKRVLKKNGTLILVLPDKRSTFDYNRPYTNFQHLLDDYQMNVNENDKTHFDEITALHDFSRDTAENTPQTLDKLLQTNFQNRCAHHHVFNQELICEILEFCGFDLTYQEEIEQFHLVTIARKSDNQ